MIENQTIDGKDAIVAYLGGADGFTPADKDAATRMKVIYVDGSGVMFVAIQRNDKDLSDEELIRRELYRAAKARAQRLLGKSHHYIQDPDTGQFGGSHPLGGSSSDDSLGHVPWGEVVSSSGGQSKLSSAKVNEQLEKNENARTSAKEGSRERIAREAISYVLDHDRAAKKGGGGYGKIFRYKLDSKGDVTAAIEYQKNGPVVHVTALGSIGKREGGNLLLGAIEHATASGASSITVEAKYGSAPYYEKFGFEPSGGMHAATMMELTIEPHGSMTHAATALYDRFADTSVTADDVFAKLPPAAKEEATKLDAKVAKLVQTASPVSEGGYMLPNGKFTPEREALWVKMVNDVFTPERIKNATPDPGQKPLMVMLGGRGGSGKSWLTGKYGLIDKEKIIVLNSDDFKEKMPGYEGWNAVKFHEETDRILHIASEKAKELGVNVAFDATMKSADKVERWAIEYEEAGYELQGYYMFTTPQVAARRSVERWYKGGAMTGRYVPPAVVLGNTRNERNFDKLKSSFKVWAIYDNNVDGREPRLIVRGGTRKEQAK